MRPRTGDCYWHWLRGGHIPISLTRYDIVIDNPQCVSRGITRVELDGAALAAGLDSIDLIDDSGVHRVRVLLGQR